MSVKVQTEYTKESLLKYARFNAYKRTLQIVAYIIMELCMLALALTLILMSDNRNELVVSIVIIMPLFLFMVPAIIYIMPIFVANMSKKLIGAVNTVIFSDEEIIIDSTLPTAAGQTKANYNYFHSIYETKDEFYLYVTKIQAYIMKKSDITEGSVSELQELFKKNLHPNKYIVKSNGSKFMPTFMVTILAVCVLIAAYSYVNVKPGNTHEKIFSESGLNITLTDSYWNKDMEPYTEVFDSKDSAIFALKEEKSEISDEDISLKEYAQLVIDNNQLDTTIVENDGLTNFTFEANNDGKDYTYFAVVYKGDDVFWLIQFSCETSKYESFKSKFIQYAKSIKV